MTIIMKDRTIKELTLQEIILVSSKFGLFKPMTTNLNLKIITRENYVREDSSEVVKKNNVSKQGM